MSKARLRMKCGRCGKAIEIGHGYTRYFGLPWHVGCALDYQAQRRAVAASLR